MRDAAPRPPSPSPVPAGRVTIFVYGTLRSGGPASGLLAGCRKVGLAELAGTLYDVAGRYPALVLGGDARVRGELWTVPVELLARLDEYEGVAEGLFRRARVTIGGEPCVAYVAGPRLRASLSASDVVPEGEWSPRGR